MDISPKKYKWPRVTWKTCNIISYQKNANQNYNEVISHTIKAITKRQIKTSVGEDVKKLELSYPASGNVKWYGHFGKQSSRSFPGGSVVKTPASAGDMGSIPDLGRSHLLQSN